MASQRGLSIKSVKSAPASASGDDGSSWKVFLCVALAIASLLLGLYLLDRHTSIFEKFSDTNDGNSDDTRKYKVMLFYAQWCGHCQALKPTWESAKGRFDSGKVVIIEVDADDDSKRSLFDEHGVTGFPTIKIIKPDGTVVDYRGDRSEDDLVRFVESNAA